MELQGGLFCEKWTIFHITSGKIKISLSNRFGAFLPRFRSLNVLYKHLDGLGLLLGSPKEGQSRKKDSRFLSIQRNQLLSLCPVENCHLFLTFFGTFFIDFERFFCFYGLTKASSRLLGADTIPRPRNHIAAKI